MEAIERIIVGVHVLRQPAMPSNGAIEHPTECDTIDLSRMDAEAKDPAPVRVSGYDLGLQLRCSLPRWKCDHVIILNERHLKRLMSSYLLYYHGDRTHLGIEKDAPAGRPTAIGTKAESKIQSFPRLGGLHHRYAVAA